MSLRLTINLDVDGVIYDFNAAMTSLCEGYLGHALPANETWDMAASWGMAEDDWYALFNQAILEDELFRVGDAIPGAIEAVHWLMKHHRVRLVTSKKLRSNEATKAAQIQAIRWLAEHEILPHVEIAFTNNKQGYLADLVVDDKPTLKWAQPGAVNLLFDQPWNRHVPDDAEVSVGDLMGGTSLGLTWVQRARGWDEVLGHVERVAHPLEFINGGGPGRGGG